MCCLQHSTFFGFFLFSNINNKTLLSCKSVLKTFNLLTVEQLIYFTYTNINYKFYSYSVILNHKYMQKPKTTQIRDLLVTELYL